MKKILSLLFLFYFTLNYAQDAEQSLNQYVNTFIGTGGHGHTFPGATSPFGMVQLSPDTRLEGWDGCGGYHYTDSIIYGFSHTHLSGTGVSDYGDILLMPLVGESTFNNGSNGRKGYSSKFSKDKEEASPGYYKVFLEEPQVEVELTASPRCGMHKYTFKSDEMKLVLDLEHRDQLTDHLIQQVDKNTIEGKRYSNAWAEDQRLHYYMSFSHSISDIEFNETKSIAVISFENSTDKNILLVKVGISAVDIEGAKNNLSEEIPGWDFDKVKTATENKWEKELSKIRVSTTDTDKIIVFYSALYHTMIAPNLYIDIDGRYRGTDNEIHTETEHDQYTIFSLWDTYRAAHPLYTIIDKKRTNDFINTFLNQYQQGGQLPIWELANNYTGCMIGYHSVPVIADAYVKGIRAYDADLALEAMISSSKAQKLGIPEYIEKGFVPGEVEAECVSKTLEYAYDDWTIAVMAEQMNNPISDEYFKRAQYYKNVFDGETGFMRARMSNRWFSPFRPEEVNFNYTEANAWQYSYYVPQDITNWMNMLGGPDALSKKLDALFEADSESSGRHQVDITGLIGQYAHGNEPSHHIAYLYNYVGETHKTQRLCRQIMNELYSPEPDGYSGNEDCGQMSAWLVLSSLGFYPVTPGSEDYVIGSPWFDEAQIQLENGNTFTIQAKNNSPENIYIQSVNYEGVDYTKSYLRHSMIEQGGFLQFEMGAKESEFGIKQNDRPKSEISKQRISAVPAVICGRKAFFDETEICINTITESAKIYYQLNDQKEVLYTKPFSIKETCELKVRAEKEGYIPSASASSFFYKMEENREIELRTEYGNHYSAGGDKALIDYIRGGNDYRTGSWQGYEGVDIEVIVDLGKQKKISSIATGFLQDENSWIFMPTKVSYYVSKNGKAFEKIGKVVNNISPKEKGTIVEDFLLKCKAKGRFLKIVAENRGVCPDYHKGAGGKSWIFADEIIVK